MSKKKKSADGLLPRAEAWRVSASEYKAHVYCLVIDDKGHVQPPIRTPDHILKRAGIPRPDGKPVRMVPAMRAKILDKVAADAAAHQDRQRKAGGSRRKNNETRGLIERVLSKYKDPGLKEHLPEQWERYTALARDSHVGYRSFKEVRLMILSTAAGTSTPSRARR